MIYLVIQNTIFIHDIVINTMWNVLIKLPKFQNVDNQIVVCGITHIFKNGN